MIKKSSIGTKTSKTHIIFKMTLFLLRFSLIKKPRFVTILETNYEKWGDLQLALQLNICETIYIFVQFSYNYVGTTIV